MTFAGNAVRAWRPLGLLVASALLLGLAACQPLTAEQQRSIEEYRRSQRCCGGGGA
jgi:hypothetical protein